MEMAFQSCQNQQIYKSVNNIELQFFYLCIFWVSTSQIIKLMMQKQSMSSSGRLNDSLSKSATSQGNRLKRKIPYKIEICNQDLEEAIRQVRTNVRDNPEWRLSVKAVASQYPPNQEKKPVNESQRLDGLQQQLPISQKLSFPSTAQPTQNSFQRLKFTQRKRKEFEVRTKQIKERRMQLQVSLLQKQMKAKLQRKIQQNMRLKEKKKLIEDIEKNREESLRFHEIQRKRKIMESSLLHESNVASVKMIRKSRTRSQRQFLNEQKLKTDESALSKHFKDIEMTKSKYQNRQIILSRYKNLRSNSQGSLLQRRSIQNLNIFHQKPTRPLTHD